MDGAALQLPSELSGEPSDLDVRESVRPVACGDEDARLRRAFERCGNDLYRFIALRVRGDSQAADDLLQQACYEAARHRRTPTGDDAAQAWLFGIARNLIRRHFRRLRREGRHRGEEGATGARPSISGGAGDELEAAGQRDVAASLLTAIAALSESDQLLLLGCYFEGRSHQELARAIGVSVRAIEGRLYRARAALRRTLDAKLGKNGS